jgi:transcriptional regulator with XRE-family HTH domain
MPADPTGRDSSIAQVLPLVQDDGRPVAAAKLLGAHLRHLRKEKGLKIKEVAPQIRASISKISRLERGESPPRDRDVLDLVRYYGVFDPRHIDEIHDLLRQAKASAWWHQYSDVTPGWLKRLIGLEDSAAVIRTYEVLVVPGLLQTPEYARAVVVAGLPSADDGEITRRVELRMARQRLLDNEQNRPKVRALLDEGILCRPVGGPGVMSKQLEHLLRVGEHERISIRIVRFNKGASIAPSSPITHLKFADRGQSELIYLEQINSAHYLSKTADVEAHRHVLDELSLVAESRQDSMRLLREAMERFSAAPAPLNSSLPERGGAPERQRL